jgi:hypothetical protein
MYKKTRIGCKNLIQKVINKYVNPMIKKYILRNSYLNLNNIIMLFRLKQLRLGYLVIT